MREKLKQVKGITLIALVITIIILIILAGVTIAMLTGDNGILSQATKAMDETEKAEKNEMSDLASMESLINEYQNNINIPQVTDENPGQLEKENDTTFVINSIEDLVFFSYDVTTKGTTYEGNTVKLGTNLDFNSDKSYIDANRTDFDKYGYSGPLKQALTTGEGFKPIGSQDLANSFYGTFDGDNKAICSLYENINKDDVARGGLFAATYGEIRNLGLVNVNITAIAQSVSVGGIAKTSYNNIYNCYVTGSINVTGSSWTPVGGLCGVMQEKANIENCYNLANINVTNIKEETGDADIGCGGILGQGNANINKCFNKGKIVAKIVNNTMMVGGICGHLDGGYIKNCYNSATVTANGNSQENGAYIAGIAGAISTELSNCYNSGEIIGTENRLIIGGITGNLYNNATVNNVFNIGKLTINANTVLVAGGINGSTDGGSNINMNYAYNIGIIDLENGNSEIGSISGVDFKKFTNCYYLKGTYDVGVGVSGTTTGVTECDSIEDFPSVLSVVNGEKAFKEDTNNINNGYPILDYQ